MPLNGLIKMTYIIFVKLYINYRSNWKLLTRRALTKYKIIIINEMLTNNHNWTGWFFICTKLLTIIFIFYFCKLKLFICVPKFNTSILVPIIAFAYTAWVKETAVWNNYNHEKGINRIPSNPLNGQGISNYEYIFIYK